VTANEMRLMELVADACMMSMSVMAGLFPAHDDEYLGKRNQIEEALSAVKRESAAPAVAVTAEAVREIRDRYVPEDWDVTKKWFSDLATRLEAESAPAPDPVPAPVDAGGCTASDFERLLIRHNVVHPEAIDDAEGYDGGAMRESVHRVYEELCNRMQPGVPVALVEALIEAGEELCKWSEHSRHCSRPPCLCGYERLTMAWYAARDAAREGGAK